MPTIKEARRSKRNRENADNWLRREFARPAKEEKLPKGRLLERVLPSLRKGQAIRRQAWKANARLNKLGSLVYMTSDFTKEHQPPASWHPYAEDLLANDWEVVK